MVDQVVHCCVIWPISLFLVSVAWNVTFNLLVGSLPFKLLYGLIVIIDSAVAGAIDIQCFSLEIVISFSAHFSWT